MTTIRHPSNANNYEKVLQQLKLTIESVCSQKTNLSYKFLIVCNEIPELAIDDTKVEFISVDFPPPALGSSQNSLPEDRFLDKGMKLSAGLLYAKKYQPSHVFIIDSDDWISNRVVEFVQNRNEDFWCVNSGNLINFKEKKSTRKHGLSRYCGTAYIYNYQRFMGILDFHEELTYQSNKKEFLQYIESHVLIYLLGHHRYQFSFFRKLGIKFKPLPFSSICWVLNTGENNTGRTGGYKGLPLTTKTLKNFGISSISPSNEAITMGNRLKELIAKMLSYFGWMFTNKNKEKI